MIRAVFPMHIMAGIENESICLAFLSHRRECQLWHGEGGAQPAPDPNLATLKAEEIGISGVPVPQHAG